ncbi:MAG: alpha/beta fold hydrolase [Candidatus Levyibacteriota bacterium]
MNISSLKSQSSRKIIIIFLFIIIICLIILGFLLLGKKSNSVFEKMISMNIFSQENELSSASFPFKELTIPYLRSKTYSSKLNNLSFVSDNSLYTEYTTSYSSDGLKINGLLTIPKEDKPKNGFPAIVFVHGYISPIQYETLKNYESYVDYFAQKGYVVFKIDFRGHANSEGEASGAYYSSDYIIDILNAYSALQNSDFVNKDKIGLWGHSMAGNLVMRSLAASPNISAIVIWAGAVYTYEDFSEFGIQDNSYRAPGTSTQRQKRRQELFDTYGRFSKDSEFWKQVAATNYLGDIKGAIQINHATDDEVVKIEYSRNLNKILNETKIPHELNEYPSGGHNISDESFDTAMQNSVNFFDKYLK